MAKQNPKARPKKADAAAAAAAEQPSASATAVAQGSGIDPSADAAQVAAAGAVINQTLADLDDAAMEDAVKNLVYRLERSAKTGHGLDSDRELQREAASALRVLIGIDADTDVGPKAAAYGSVKNDPPIGHSL